MEEGKKKKRKKWRRLLVGLESKENTLETHPYDLKRMEHSLEEWPEEVYPPYANGPGYILSSDIAQYILSEFENHNLRLFKMEDISMGVWVEQFNNSTRRGAGVEYVHSLNFCQFGCMQDYYTAHYQSPRQMMCLWETLLLGE